MDTIYDWPDLVRLRDEKYRLCCEQVRVIKKKCEQAQNEETRKKYQFHLIQAQKGCERARQRLFA